MNKYKLSQSTIEKLGYYVYLLIDPCNMKVFYIGKGKGSRIYNHLIAAEFSKIKDIKSSEKLTKINDLKKENKEVILDILRHGMDEKEALEVESASIDLLGLPKVTNKIKGHSSGSTGRMNLKEIKIIYEAKKVEIKEPAVLVRINKLYTYRMKEGELYEATRQAWRVAPKKANKANLIFSVYRGIIRGIFQDCIWSEIKRGKDKGRYAFVGRNADKIYLDLYLDRSVNSYFKQGAVNPIRYLNIK